MSPTFVCELCKGEFENGWSDTEQAEEAKRLWGDLSVEESSVICEDCFQKFMKWYDKKIGVMQ